jgi:DNA-binding transcriptional regulator YdaS (Cro superfamily)
MVDKEISGIDQAIAVAGGQQALADQVGCTQQNVSFWRRQGFVPVERVVEIEQATGVPRALLVAPKIRSVLDTTAL